MSEVRFEIDPSDKAWGYFVLLGRNELCGKDLALKSKEDALTSKVPLVHELLKMPYFIEARAFRRADSDCIGLKLRPGINWDKPFTQDRRSIPLKDAFAEKIARSIGGNAFLEETPKQIANSALFDQMKEYFEANLPDIIEQHKGGAALKSFNAATGLLIAEFSGPCASACLGNRIVTQKSIENTMRMRFPGRVRSMDFLLVS